MYLSLSSSVRVDCVMLVEDNLKSKLAGFLCQRKLNEVYNLKEVLHI